MFARVFHILPVRFSGKRAESRSESLEHRIRLPQHPFSAGIEPARMTSLRRSRRRGRGRAGRIHSARIAIYRPNQGAEPVPPPGDALLDPGQDTSRQGSLFQKAKGRKLKNLRREFEPLRQYPRTARTLGGSPPGNPYLQRRLLRLRGSAAAKKDPQVAFVKVPAHPASVPAIAREHERVELCLLQARQQ